MSDSSNSKSIQHPMPIHSFHDPLTNYQHICDSCTAIKEKRNEPKDKELSTMFKTPEPQAYDPNDHITHNLNVCFQSPDVLRCHLEPNNKNQN